MEETFSPPLIIGQVIVAFTVSWLVSSIVVLKSLFSDFEKFSDIEIKSPCDEFILFEKSCFWKETGAFQKDQNPPS